MAGLVGCLAAAGTLAVHLWRTDRGSLWLVGSISAGLLVLRGAYLLVGAGGESACPEDGARER